ncbi:MAG TPA: NAD(P)H-hydrate epimerase, partial [Flavisolibacter sp.]|nr:NAD(P)H-hydrate epimerase [Flavisolibacter sp.]
MYVLSAAEIRNWDQFTINNEPIASIDLMERAAARCFEWIIQQGFQKNQFYIFCGKGNNGGDGLAIARLLMQSGYKISIYILNTEEPGSADFQENLKRLQKLNAAIRLINVVADLPEVQKDGIVVDALFGTGLSRPVAGIAENIIALINDSRAKVISIDLPSGMFADKSSVNNMIVRAHFTLTFQCYKLGLLVAENELFTGKVILLQIGLHPAFVPGNLPVTKILTQKLIEKLYRPRSSFAHKGTFGHALIMGGSKGKIGAMILAVRACLHTGAGLTSASLPGCGYVII